MYETEWGLDKVPKFCELIVESACEWNNRESKNTLSAMINNSIAKI